MGYRRSTKVWGSNPRSNQKRHIAKVATICNRVNRARSTYAEENIGGVERVPHPCRKEREQGWGAWPSMLLFLGPRRLLLLLQVLLLLSMFLLQFLGLLLVFLFYLLLPRIIRVLLR